VKPSEAIEACGNNQAVSRVSNGDVMDDAPAISHPSDLPDDPALLKRIILDLSRRHETQLAEHKTKLAELELDKLRLQYQLDLLRKRCYGPRADRVELGQLLLGFAEQLDSRPVDEQDLPSGREQSGPVDQDANRKSLRRVRRGRRDLAAFDRLPVTRCEHDLAEEHKPCPCCGQARQRIGQESSWQVEFVPGYFHRIEHVRYKYACRHCEQEALAPQIALADKPPQAIDKGMAGPGLLAYVATSKFADYLPLYRLEGIFARNGLEIDRSTMCLWMRDVADLVQPLYRRMVQRVLASHVLATDDTVMPMLQPGKAKQARMWVYVGDEHHPYNVFDFTEGRSRDGPASFLGDYKQVLLADAYGGYDGICVEKQIVQAGCWAHARRKFVDTRDLDPPAADELLVLIRRLFAVEEQGKGLSATDRLELRRQQSAPLTQQLYERLACHKQRLLPKHPVAGAISYVLNQWQPLTAFLADGAIPLDNNVSEREMKRIALLRKNALFAGNARGGRTVAVLSSLTSTCRRHGVDPQLYLTQLLANLPAWPLSDIDHWLPDVWKRRQPAGEEEQAGV
jgi:transposase